MKAVILVFFLMHLQINAACSDSVYLEKDQKRYGEIIQLVCDDASVEYRLYLAKVHKGWARVLVDSTIIYYLHKTEHWMIVASGRRFDTLDWEKLKIPEHIR